MPRKPARCYKWTYGFRKNDSVYPYPYNSFGFIFKEARGGLSFHALHYVYRVPYTATQPRKGFVISDLNAHPIDFVSTEGELLRWIKETYES